MKSRLSISACLLLLVILAMEPASGITVSGIALVTDVSPGEQIVYNMTATADDVSEPVDVTAHITAFTHNLIGERVPIPDNETAPYTARDFLKVTPERATIEPGGEVVFVLEGIVPEDVGDGLRYALVRISTVPSGNETIEFASEVDVPVFLTIAGSEIISRGEISDLNVSEGDDEGLVVTFLFTNTGNHYCKAEGTAVLKDDEGNVIDEGSHPSGSSVLPSTTRQCVFELAKEVDLAPGTYTVEATVAKTDGTVLDTEVTTVEI
ncbi:MAG TPA: hypothetical protein PLM24_05145 [Methanothrix sp.]|nr:hypothetical protein [Methanothrix sp.]HPJ84134.1 hypothetical protein [Methanothrix sp.]HPR66504.1 hypothetical protein [Methanothrix sp.]